MLLELTITNFAIIDHLRLELGPHLNVFTGETGAGKSIIIDAISALLGDRVGGDVVRAGTDRASVEGIIDVSALLRDAQDTPTATEDGHHEPTSEPFDAASAGDSPTGEPASLAAALAAAGIVAEDGTLILAREITRTGRGVARVNGRAVPLSILQGIARFLVDVHGQGAHLALLRPERHIYLLDRYASAEPQREQVAALVAEWRAVRREYERLQRDERETERQIELLRYQVDEIGAAQLQPDELEELERERRVLANAEHLLELCAAIHAALAGDDDADAPGALALLSAAQHALADLRRVDETLATQQETLEQALFLAEDVATSVRSYQEEIGVDPERQAQVEERLDLIAKLRRKYGATIAEILAFAGEAAHELDALEHREEHAATLAASEQELRNRIGARAYTLSRIRSAASKRLAAAMERELKDLNMTRARFETSIAWRPDQHGAPLPVQRESAAAAPASAHAAKRASASPASTSIAAKRETAAKTATATLRTRDIPAKTATTSPAGTATAAKTATITARPSEIAAKAAAPGTPAASPSAPTTDETPRAPSATECVAFGPTGIDQVEFLIAPNPGEPLKPLARIASGGETSRLMLALKTILTDADDVPILIFDEVDAGISGRSGQVVGEKLWQLARAHQVLVVTHLPQIAAIADTHFNVSKAIADERTTTHVEPLAPPRRVEEIGQMLAGASTRAGHDNAADLLARASAWKEQASIVAKPTSP